MKLTGDLKKVEDSESREAKKAAIEQAGMELTDDELDKVAGGAWCGEFVEIGISELNQLKSLRDDYHNWCAFKGCPECEQRKLLVDYIVPSLREVRFTIPNRGDYIGYICERKNEHKFLE